MLFLPDCFGSSSLDGFIKFQIPAHSIVVPMPGKVLIIRFFGVLLKTAVLKTMAFRIKLTTNYG